jgi:macrolide transport system ATP-binding/permease protein
MQEAYGPKLHVLIALSGLVLLIACANIANLLLARGMARKTEICIRTALGAGRWRIIRQLLTESLALSALGGIAGLALAYAGTRVLLALAFPGTQNIPIQASPSPFVLMFGCGLSLLTGILFGAAPAWIAAQTEPADVLRSGVARTTAAGASRLQRGLVILQAALSLVLLVIAGLVSRSLHQLQNTDLKLESRNRYIAHINPQAAGYSQRQVEALYRAMEERFHALPGVEKVGISSYTPMEDRNFSRNVQVEGKPDPNIGSSYIKINSEYFDSVGTRVVLGYAVLLRPLPYPEPERLVHFATMSQEKGLGESSFTDQLFAFYRDHNRIFESLAVYAPTGFNLADNGEPERLRGANVTADFFRFILAAIY